MSRRAGGAESKSDLRAAETTSGGEYCLCCIETHPARRGTYPDACLTQGSVQSRPASLGREAQWEGILSTQSPSSPLVVGYLSFRETDWMEPSLKNIETGADDRLATYIPGTTQPDFGINTVYHPLFPPPPLPPLPPPPPPLSPFNLSSSLTPPTAPPCLVSHSFASQSFWWRRLGSHRVLPRRPHEPMTAP